MERDGVTEAIVGFVDWYWWQGDSTSVASDRGTAVDSLGSVLEIKQGSRGAGCITADSKGHQRV